MAMPFPVVNCLIETLGDLQRSTLIAIEINKLQYEILREQRVFRLDDSLIDSVQLLERPFILYVERAASKMFCELGVFEYPTQLYPPVTALEKNVRVAMRKVLCRKSKLFLHFSIVESLDFLIARGREIFSLIRDLCFLQSLLKDFDSICNIPEKRQQLEVSLAELACRTEDVIEAYVFDHSINSKTFNFISSLVNEEKPSSIMGEVPFLKEISNVFDKKNGIRKHLRQTVRKIDLIKREVKRIYDEAPIVTGTLQLGVRNAIMDSLQHKAETKKNEVFDIDNDGLVSVLDRVIRIPSALEVVPIVGMGGIGKTTLAQRVFHHPLTCYHFYIRAWVVVSQVHQVRDILIGLLRCTKEITNEIYEKNNGQLAEELYRSLKGKRFLIVLDNIWSTKAWDDVKRCFPDDKNSSRIVMTTRLMKVADYVNPKQPPHYVNLLDADQSWKLLKQMVFGEEEPHDLEFEDVGKRIARKCQGLPLAVVIVAGILKKITRTSVCWEVIAQDVSSAVSSDPEQCLEVLALSYNHLPCHLKTCLLYMGAFPEDSEIEVPKLINLWIAEGFLDKAVALTPNQIKFFLMDGGYKSMSLRFSISSMEIVARDYLEDLIDRNLVLVGKRSFNGIIKTCRLHDLVQDLCLREAQKAKFMHVVKGDSSISFPSSMINQRRLSFHSNVLGNSHSVPPMPLVRSFLYFDLGFGGNIPDTLFFNLSFKLLRVLDIVFLRFQYFPFQILKLVQLRYLAFTATFELPISISKLRHLQALIVYGPWIRREHERSPNLLLEYWKMPGLRHLHTSIACYLSNPIIAIKYFFSGKTHNLQSLSAITFSSCSEEIFSFFNILRKLGIVESEEDYRTDNSSKWLSNLVHLKCLQELKCSFYALNTSPRNSVHWLFPSSLKKLTLSWSYVPWEDITPVAMLPTLEVLKLKNHAFQGPEWEPSEEGFRHLKHLLIENHDLVHLEASRIHFPCLEHLALRSCMSLEEISFGIAEIPTLQLIELHYCSESAENSAKEIQEQIDGLDVDIRSSMYA